MLVAGKQNTQNYSAHAMRAVFIASIAAICGCSTTPNAELPARPSVSVLHTMPLLTHGPTDPYDRMVYCGETAGYRCPEVTKKTPKIVPRETMEPTSGAQALAAGVIQGMGQQLAAKVAPAPVPAAPVTFGNVLFAFNSSALTPEAVTELKSAVQKLKGKQVELAGYTDSVGGEGYNNRLALARATAVRDFLLGQGVQLGAIDLKGQGLCCYVSPNDSDDSRRLNRRVEIRQKAS